MIIARLRLVAVVVVVVVVVVVFCCLFVEISLRALIPLFKPGSVHSAWWLGELKQMWTSIPCQVACELVSLIGSHTMPAHHSQPLPTSLGQGCMRV